ncbi:cytosolic 80S ribosome and 60S large subunit [Gracilaria domingensis]|nr:80S ribosome and 60S large subunit [Gracilaria domingensis]KAI0557511.1 cytosolic 80S ribosome and 60S large subunit [Gracilaria domingensis]
MGTAAWNTRDSRDGASGTPGGGGGLHAGHVVDGVRLTAVLPHVGVHELNNVVADRGGEDGRHGDGAGRLAGLRAEHGDDRTGSGCGGHGSIAAERGGRGGGAVDTAVWAEVRSESGGGAR